MYEAFFGLKRRPFAATPDANCWFHCERYQAALDELLICAEQGQGIGVIVAPAGVGKTLLCERLIREIGEPFTSVYLRHATFQNRRGFLQTLLSELAQPFDKSSDQELRLALAPVLRGLGQQGRAMLLVVDEAHRLSEKLLEELRILADQAEDGRPLVRLVLCGQAELEDKLAHPQLQALSQRIRSHISFPSLSLEESRDYLDYRITWAGGRTEELFTPAAVELICRASDGVPRCLNQLADHALLLAYVSETRPADQDLIEQALEDLRHLPLSFHFQRSAEPTAVEFDMEWTEPAFEADLTATHPAESADDLSLSPEIADEDWSPASDDLDLDVDDAPAEADSPTTELAGGGEPPQSELPSEELIVDRYAAIDAGLSLPPEPVVDTTRETLEGSPIVPVSDQLDLFEHAAADLLQSAPSIDRKLDIVQKILEYVNDGAHPRAVPQSLTELPSSTGESSAAEQTYPLPSTSAAAEELRDRHSLETPREDEDEDSGLPTVYEFGAPTPSSTTPEPATAGDTHSPPTLRTHFTMLRRKQMGR